MQQGFERSWENGTSIIDIVSGFPEILSLYRLTNKDKYLNYVIDILKKLKEKNHFDGNFQMFIFYDNENGNNKTSEFFNNQNLANFKIRHYFEEIN